MLKSIIQNTEWEDLFSLVPAIFDVLPLTSAMKQSQKLVANYVNHQKFQDALLERDRTLAEKQLPVVVRAYNNRNAPLRNLVHHGMEAHAHGETVLALFFHQLFARGPTLLDLRKAAFEENSATLVWSPRPAIAELDEAFRASLQRVYVGFYGGDHQALDDALDALGLLPAKDIFMDAFGGGRGGKVAFSLKEFQHTFARVFDRCRKAGTHLPGDFLPFGLYVASLYEHLDALGGAWDVKKAYERAFDPAALLNHPAPRKSRATSIFGGRLHFRT